MNVVRKSRQALKRLDWRQVDATIAALSRAERIFCYGNGGGYAHAAHFAADLRKIAYKRAYSFDSMGELTARVNDDGWESAWADWRESHDYQEGDLDFLFSVGGGIDGLSRNLPAAPYGIVGGNGQLGMKRIVIPSSSTPVVEGCQSVIAHHIVEQLCGG